MDARAAGTSPALDAIPAHPRGSWGGWVRVPVETSTTIIYTGPVGGPYVPTYPNLNLSWPPLFVGYHHAEPVAPTRPILGGVAAALVMGAALATPRRLSRRSLLTGGLLSALLAFAAPVAAQTAPNRLEVVQFVTDEDPARFACAHSGRPCEADWIKAVAAALHAEDAHWGLNMKRDSDSQGLSLDVVTWRVGPTDRHVLVFDICGACGSSAARPTWNEITVHPIGAPGSARWVKPATTAPAPQPSPTPVPTPPPAPQPPVDLAPVLAKLDAILAEITILRAQHDGIAAVATEARDKAADAHVEALNAASRAAEIKAAQGKCYEGAFPKAWGGSQKVQICPAP